MDSIFYKFEEIVICKQIIKNPKNNRLRPILFDYFFTFLIGVKLGIRKFTKFYVTLAVSMLVSLFLFDFRDSFHFFIKIFSGLNALGIVFMGITFIFFANVILNMIFETPADAFHDDNYARKINAVFELSLENVETLSSENYKLRYELYSKDIDTAISKCKFSIWFSASICLFILSKLFDALVKVGINDTEALRLYRLFTDIGAMPIYFSLLIMMLISHAQYSCMYEIKHFLPCIRPKTM